MPTFPLATITNERLPQTKAAKSTKCGSQEVERRSVTDVRARMNPVTAVTGYFAAPPGDSFEHVVTASGDGTLREIFWTP